MNFAVLEPPVKVFSTKFGYAIPTYDRFQHSTKILLTKWSLLPIHESFLPQKFPAIYGMDGALHIHICLEWTLRITDVLVHRPLSLFQGMSFIGVFWLIKPPPTQSNLICSGYLEYYSNHDTYVSDLYQLHTFIMPIKPLRIKLV